MYWHTNRTVSGLSFSINFLKSNRNHYFEAPRMFRVLNTVLVSMVLWVRLCKDWTLLQRISHNIWVMNTKNFTTKLCRSIVFPLEFNHTCTHIWIIPFTSSVCWLSKHVCIDKYMYYLFKRQIGRCVTHELFWTSIEWKHTTRSDECTKLLHPTHLMTISIEMIFG